MREVVRKAGSGVAAVARSDSGGVLSEYGLLMALVAVACIAAMIFFGGAIAGKFKNVGTQVQNAQPVQ